MPGQAVSGDMHLVRPFEDGVLVALVDGLGHGEEAALRQGLQSQCSNGMRANPSLR